MPHASPRFLTVAVCLKSVLNRDFLPEGRVFLPSTQERLPSGLAVAQRYALFEVLREPTPQLLAVHASSAGHGIAIRESAARSSFTSMAGAMQRVTNDGFHAARTSRTNVSAQTASNAA